MDNALAHLINALTVAVWVFWSPQPHLVPSEF